MISILIPVYNFDVRLLVKALQQQAAAVQQPVEIYCLDDASSEPFQHLNNEIRGWENVRYEILKENVGRARIRNLMAQRAHYDYLLFMDSDSKVISGRYLSNYLNYLPFDGVICGGRTYQKKAPSEDELFFHWKYGTTREARNAAERQQKPYHGFMTNNFLVAKNILLRIGFDENIKQYGHEDTLLGFELRRRQIRILHIDNPLQHIGLELQSEFLEKSVKAVENLVALQKQYPELETRLTQMAKRLDAFGVTFLLSKSLKLLRPLLYRHFKSPNPSLFYFDLYKLSYFLEMIKEK